MEESMHWKNYLFPAAVMCLCLIILPIRYSFEGYSVLNALCGARILPGNAVLYVSVFEELALGAVVLAMFSRIVTISYTKYYLSDRRIVCVSGVFDVSYEEMLLSCCEMVFLHRNASETMFNCGDILCVSAGANLLLEDVKDAIRFKQTLMGLLSKRISNEHTPAY